MSALSWLNYHHLHYFWLVVRLGSVAQAAARLRLSHATVLGQIRTLEAQLGEKLLVRQGRALVPTDVGRTAYGYADQIFALGQELTDALSGRPGSRTARVVVGIAQVVPKLVAKRLLAPARELSTPVQLVCREDEVGRLLAELATHAVDVVLADAPLPPSSGVKAYNHLLGACGIGFFAKPELAKTLRRRFPKSLDGAPLLLPTPLTALRRGLDQWLDARGIRPKVEAEFDDSALMKTFGADGAGVFPAAIAIEREVRAQFGVELVGRADDLREQFYAISPERRVTHPAVDAVCRGAREDLFAPTPAARARRVGEAGTARARRRTKPTN